MTRDEEGMQLSTVGGRLQKGCKAKCSGREGVQTEAGHAVFMFPVAQNKEKLSLRRERIANFNTISLILFRAASEIILPSIFFFTIKMSRCLQMSCYVRPTVHKPKVISLQ